MEWTADLAYIVGLFVTDGNLSKDGRHLIMRSSDKDLLEVVANCLLLKNKISISTNNGFAKKPSFRIQFGNIKLYKWFLSIGLTPNKTHTIGTIDIPSEYFRDFLRGHLDGDGTILLYEDKYNFYLKRNYINQRLYVKFISVSKVHILWLHNKIKALADVQGSLACYKPIQENRVPMWTIKFSKKESLKLLPWLYYEKSLPCLERKRLLATQALESAKNYKRKTYTKIGIT